MKRTLKLLILNKTEDYIKSLSVSEQIKITSDFRKMSDGDLEIVSTKQLKGSIRELIVGNHRLIYFIDNGVLYFVDAFRKRSQKTPKNKIENAIKIYKIIKKKNKKQENEKNRKK